MSSNPRTATPQQQVQPGLRSLGAKAVSSLPVPGPQRAESCEDSHDIGFGWTCCYDIAVLRAISSVSAVSGWVWDDCRTLAPGHMRMTLRIILRISRLHFEEDRIGGRHLLNMPWDLFLVGCSLCVVHKVTAPQPPGPA